jgi:hypothetical protein
MTDPAPRKDGPAVPEDEDDNWAERVERRTGKTVQEVVTLLVLSLTAVLTAWCGFQSSKWGGEMSIAFSQASSSRIQAASASGLANASRQFDLTIWASYANAVATGEDELRDYIEERFTPEFQVAYDDWVAGGQELKSPFKEPSYVPNGTIEAEELSARADAKFQQALDNNAQGDQYSLLVVLFALVLFFAAMSGRDFAVWVTRAFLGIAIVLLVVGATILVTFPVII